MGVRDPEVGKFQKNNLKSSRPRFNFDAKQKSELQNFVLERHPSIVFNAEFDILIPPGINRSRSLINFD